VPSEWQNTKGIHVLGERKPDEVVEIFKSADIFVSPTKGELFTLVMQEAFACGLPVITTKEKEYEQYNLDERGIVLCDSQSATLKRELLSLAHSPDRLQFMSTYSRQLAESLFDWNKNIEQIFDVYKDANTKKVIVTTSWDDGHKLDVRVAGLLKQYGIKGTFYVASKNREFKEGEALTELELCTLSRDFEIGAHTVTHRLLTQVPESDVEEEITESKKLLENILKKDIVSFCYPRGKYSKKIAKYVAGAGFSYARTVKRFHTNYMVKNKLLAPTSIDTYDHYSDVLSVLKFVHFNPFTFFKYFRKWDAIAIEMFDRTRKHGGVFHLWGHSWQLEEHGDWNRLDKVLKHIGGHADVYYLENKDIYMSR